LTKPKNLFILHYPPPVHGAAMIGQYIKNSQLVNSQLQAKYINLSTSVSVDEIGKNGLKKWFRYSILIFKTCFYGLFWRPDLVYITLSSHGAGLIKDSAVVLICRLLRLKHVFHFHNKGVKQYAKTPIGAFLHPFVFKKAEVILLSPCLFGDIEDFVSTDRVHYCANGIPEFTKDCFEQDNKFCEDKPLELLFLSNLIASKGIWEVLHACVLLRNDKMSFHCTLAGGEGDVKSDEVQHFIRTHELESFVTYVGKVAGETKSRVFQNANIFLHPSQEDCFPLVLLEAMQFGLPIISTYEGAIPEIVEENRNGFLIKKNNALALAETIKRYILDPSLVVKQSKLNKLKYNEKYQVSVFEERFCTVINSILDKNNSA
jgi:glycosyltransferase involved in cell wall biosynthesis